MRRIRNNEVFRNLVDILRRKIRPILFLGAGCSIESGLPDMKQLLESFGKTSFDDLIRSLTDDVAFRIQVSDRLPPPTDTSSYEMLAHLVVEGYFDTILTTNWDYLLETSLSHFLTPRDYRTYVRPEVPDDMIADALRRPEKLIKVVKLHGDTFSRPIIDPKEIMKLGDNLTTQLRRMIEDRGLIVAGYALEERRFIKLLGEARSIYIVTPRRQDRSHLNQLGGGAHQIYGDAGTFGYFIQGLCYELLGNVGTYRTWTEPISDSTQYTHWVSPKEGHRKVVDKLVDGIDDRREDFNLSEDRVKGLVTSMLDKIKALFHSELEESGSGVCLVFIHDPAAPGGAEIQRLVQLDDHLRDIATGMILQSVELGYEEGRHVTKWNCSSDNLSTFGAVVLIDSVSFTGNTLELARDYLSDKGGREKDRFTAAVLLLPKGLERKLKEGSSRDHVPAENPSERWWDVICPMQNYSGFEVTFPWGWTTATRPVMVDLVTETDPFFPRDQFSYIPKPWGDQLTYSANSRASVSLLMLERGQRTSNHFHLCRSETFIVLDNRLRICIWDRYIELHKHDSIRIPPGVPHSLVALDQPCRVLEIATGFYDPKCDIVRLWDIYYRKTNLDEDDDGLR